MPTRGAAGVGPVPRLRAGRGHGCPGQPVADQLWFGTSPHRPAVSPRPDERALAPVPASLAIADQEPLFAATPRTWSRLRGRPLPELAQDAQVLLAALDQLGRAQRWGTSTLKGNLRVLRTALAVLGADQPIAEDDIRAIARTATNYAGRRVAHFLDARGLLIQRPGRDIGMDRAAASRLLATAPAAYRDDLDAWVR